MKPVLFSVPGVAIAHFVLLELIRLSRTNGNGFHYINMDYKVSCETLGNPEIEERTGLPEQIRCVLSDARIEALADTLVGCGALRVLVDLDVLQRRCELIGRQWHDECLLRAFIRAQASVPMIRQFFRTATRSVVVRLRQEMGVPAPTKPRMPTFRETDALLERWHSLREISDPRERYLALHRECCGTWSLASLFAALDSAANPDVTSPRRTRPSSNSRESHHVRHAPRPGGQPATGQELE
ncbi:hypothetical protein F3J20_11820 [Paraburkholderia sp. Cy-641]|uniref:hypothetical protein n=1 Tax=Paraburkholderia sp. Cy-641 TaxID=2608337 RepID=UPI00141EEBBF|nr:hypothetical protein [Paraburkholderia sp. Cy-641]NIF78076.1 hypothetical protein [Paraburkholderia sp. Cy-641]